MALYKQIFVAIILIFNLSGCYFSSLWTNSPIAQKGVLDLRQWDFDAQGFVNLNGEWEFYWKKWLIDNPIDTHSKVYVKTPSSWNGLTIQGNTLSGNGYASYKLRILLNKKHPALALKLLSFGTAYSLYINGKQVAQNGQIGNSYTTSTPYNLPMVIGFENYSEEVEIIVQVSNFHHRQGGFWQNIMLGKEHQVQMHRDRLVAIDLILAGCLLIMAVYHFGMYLLRSKDKSALYFSIVSILFTFRTLLTDEKYLLHLFPSLPWWFTFRLEYLTIYAGFPMYLLFFKSVYPREFDSRLLRYLVYLFIPFTALVVLTPTHIFSHSLPIIQFVMFGVGLYLIYALTRAFQNSRTGSKIFLFGFLIFFGTNINDILFQLGIVHTNYFSAYGLLIFIFSQSFVLSIRYARAFLKAEMFSATLEQKVSERTAEIQQQKDEISEQHEIIDKKNQNITASINYASRIQQAILGSTDAITSNFKDSFIFLRPKDIVSGDFYWYTEVKKSSSNLPGSEHKTLFFKVIVAADCTGHGIPGAFMTVLGNTLLDEIINENRVTNPSKILSLLDRKLLMKLQRHNVNDGMDISILIFDDENNKVSFSGANNPLYYVRDGEMFQVKGSKFPIGSSQYHDKKKFDLHTFDYLPGDIYYIFSDGFQDQFGGPENRKYYKKQFRDFLLEISSLPLKEQKTRLEVELDQWKGGHTQTDDVLVIGIKV